MAKIVLFGANPQGTTLLRLNKEIRSIIQAVESSGFHTPEIQFLGAVRKEDLQSSLIKHGPSIVHFSGHGTSEGELVLEDDSGGPTVISADALAAIFANFSDTVRCVVLNSCYSEWQASGIKKHIPCVIGMTSLVEDNVAISFSSKFYASLANGFTVKRAFEIARTEMILYDWAEKNTPILVNKSGVKAEQLTIPLFPSVQAKFELNNRGNPKVDGSGHYSLEIFIDNAPRDVSSVVYQLNDETVSDPFCEESRRIMHFSMETSLYGDIEVRATLWKTNGSGVGLSVTLGQALREYYLHRKPSKAILSAIKVIESN